MQYPPNTWMYSPTQKPSEPHTLGIILEALVCRYDSLLILSLAPLRFLDEGWARQSQTSNDGLVFLVTGLHPEAMQKATENCIIRTVSRKFQGIQEL